MPHRVPGRRFRRGRKKRFWRGARRPVVGGGDVFQTNPGKKYGKGPLVRGRYRKQTRVLIRNREGEILERIISGKQEKGINRGGKVTSEGRSVSWNPRSN